VSVIGLNVSADGAVSPSLVRGLGATWIRIVARPEHNIVNYLRACRSDGIRVLLVYAKESFAGLSDRREALVAYRQLYGDLVDAHQVGNEPDLVSSSSWSMTPPELVAFGKLVRDVFPRPTHLVVGGLGSGQPGYLQGVDLTWADSLAVHPYLKDAPSSGDLEDLPDVDGLVAAYRAIVPATMPIVVSEWGWWGDREDRATEETREMTLWAGRRPVENGIEAFFYFCAGDFMVAPFGLLDAQGRHKDRADAFTAAARTAVATSWPEASAEPTPPAATPDPWEWWSADQIAATISVPARAVEEHWPRLVAQLKHAGIYDLSTAVAMLATVAIETAHTFRPIHEFPDPARYPQSGGYPPHYSGGALYHGRGFIQLTHDYNYRAASVAVSKLWGTEIVPDPQLDLVAVPDRALDPDISAAVAACYFRDHGREDGVGIPEAARAGDWREVRRLVQGGDAGLNDFTFYAQTLLATADGAPEPEPAPPTAAEELAAMKIALADVCDRVGDQLEASLAEIRRIRVQFLGPRP
jgi:hypothetical protein